MLNSPCPPASWHGLLPCVSPLTPAFAVAARAGRLCGQVRRPRGPEGVGREGQHQVPLFSPGGLWGHPETLPLAISTRRPLPLSPDPTLEHMGQLTACFCPPWWRGTWAQPEGQPRPASCTEQPAHAQQARRFASNQTTFLEPGEASLPRPGRATQSSKQKRYDTAFARIGFQTHFSPPAMMQREEHIFCVQFS